MASPPILIEPIPLQTALEGSAFLSLDYNDYIGIEDEESEHPHFFTELADGKPLPKGLVCTPDGLLSGTPEKGTQGEYEVKIIAKNNAETPLEVNFRLIIAEKVTAEPGQPVLVKPIPSMVVNEGAALGPIDLNQYIHAYDPQTEKLRFSAELADGASLPKGIICTSTGILSGIPAANTIGQFEVHLAAENPENGAKLTSKFNLTIKERLKIGGEMQFYTGLKAQIWDALGKNQPVPAFEELFHHQQLTVMEIYYLMQRFATLTIYDVYNLDPPGEPHLLTLPGASPHYLIYDRGSCLVGAPKDLFSHARTQEDAFITSKVMAREVYKRGWTVELVGFQKMIRAAWVEMQVQGKKHGNFLDILHYTPTQNDIKLYEAELQAEVSLGKTL